ncbi:tyrosine-type recombinase/integrase [Tateyamaria sp. SN3-11]|uniref:tyrosine-type recombinase/integrase n=1 Tax=Tateyamaria sp. SN3-11 TaxID=3092147 RepID=UPI0039E976FF
MGKLKATDIAKLPKGKHTDGNGLRYTTTGNGKGSWTVRFSVKGTPFETGLGSYPQVGLSEARTRAAEARAAKMPAKVKAPSAGVTLSDIADEWLDFHTTNIKNKSGPAHYRRSFHKVIVAPFGNRPLHDITPQELALHFEPHWNGKRHGPISDALGKLNLLLAWYAKRDMTVNVGLVDTARKLLGKSSHKPKHRKSLYWRDVPYLYADLPHTIHHDCLRLILLTLVRVDSALGARHDEFHGRHWHVPPERTKRGLPFYVPKTPALIDLEQRCARDYGTEWLFPAVRQRTPIYYSKFHEMVSELPYDFHTHGLRSSFKAWAKANKQSYETAERVLHHKFGGSVQHAYDNPDSTDPNHLYDDAESRESIMQEWSKFVLSGNNVAVINRAA